MRLLLETVRLIRDELPDVSLLVRISATEYVPDGYSEKEAVALALALEREGVVAIDLSGGSNESPALSRYCIQPPSLPRRCLEPVRPPAEGGAEGAGDRCRAHHHARGRRRRAGGGKRRLRVARTRPLIADPHWCAKAFGEVRAPIRWVHLVQRVLRASDARAGRLLRRQSDGRDGVRDPRPSRAADPPGSRGRGRPTHPRAGRGRGRDGGRPHGARARARGGDLGARREGRRAGAARARGPRQGGRRRDLDLQAEPAGDAGRLDPARNRPQGGPDPPSRARSRGGRDRRPAPDPSDPDGPRSADSAGVERSPRSRPRRAGLDRDDHRRRPGGHRDGRSSWPSTAVR